MKLCRNIPILDQSEQKADAEKLVLAVAAKR